MYTQETQNNAALKLDTLSDVIYVTIDRSRYGLTCESTPVWGLRINLGESTQVVWGHDISNLCDMLIEQIKQQLRVFPHSFDMDDIDEKLEAQIPKDINDFFKPRTTRSSTLEDFFDDLTANVTILAGLRLPNLRQTFSQVIQTMKISTCVCTMNQL